MHLAKSIIKRANKLLDRFDKKIVDKDELVDFYLHEYESYEQYRDIQTYYNKQKLSNVWADEETLGVIAEELKKLYGRSDLKGLCHGSRNGFEQAFFRDTYSFDCIGTDISDTATQFENSVQWDFHDENPDWLGQFDFVYSNSLDQGWNPRKALTSWLGQVHTGGYVVLEHTEAHGPKGASGMDPFGVRPTVMPYVLCDWFGFSISIKVVKTYKSNVQMDAWLFFIKKLG
ncbi:hypothetical protein [Roseibium sp.]|uniref:hypothetical protein n=1 Tax=Roseibium sp. TaxID=1936156 RepID=UPI003A985EBD